MKSTWKYEGMYKLFSVEKQWFGMLFDWALIQTLLLLSSEQVTHMIELWVQVVCYCAFKGFIPMHQVAAPTHVRVWGCADASVKTDPVGMAVP